MHVLGGVGLRHRVTDPRGAAGGSLLQAGVRCRAAREPSSAVRVSRYGPEVSRISAGDAVWSRCMGSLRRCWQVDNGAQLR